MKKLNFKKIALSTLAAGFAFGAPASLVASEVRDNAILTLDNVDEDEEYDEIYIAAGCGAHGCSSQGSTPSTAPSTPSYPSNSYNPNADQDDLQRNPQNVPQYQQNTPYQQNPSTKGHGCGGMIAKSSGIVDAAKRSNLI